MLKPEHTATLSPSSVISGPFQVTTHGSVPSWSPLDTLLEQGSPSGRLAGEGLIDIEPDGSLPFEPTGNGIELDIK
jgi:hypothetical protein